MYLLIAIMDRLAQNGILPVADAEKILSACHSIIEIEEMQAREAIKRDREVGLSVVRWRAASHDAKLLLKELVKRASGLGLSRT